MPIKLIADSGATKCEWCLLNNGKKKTFVTTGISPYFLSADQIIELLQVELIKRMKGVEVEEVHFYGTGLGNPTNITIITKALKKVFTKATVKAHTDLFAAARALCGNDKGIACILGTGCNSGYYNGKKIAKNIRSLGFILGDEGSGAHLGKKIIQHYLYDTFDEDLKAKFNAQFGTNYMEILENIYKKPFPNRYLAGFTPFLSQNRGHYMVENILEDGLNDFFVVHLNQYAESSSTPIHFTGSVAFNFKDVLGQLCENYGFKLGKVLKAPMEGLIKYHND
jgi:glucosamine kinase